MNIEEIKVKLEELPEFVINKIISILQEYDIEFNQAETVKFDKCPKCGKVHPHIIKGGKTKGGKQMYRCKNCNARFTSDYGFITFGSRLSKEVWNEAIKSTLEGDSLTFMAKRCRVSRLSAFYMRHKIMMHLETVEFCCMNSLGALGIRMIYRYAYKCGSQDNILGSVLRFLLKVFSSGTVMTEPDPDGQKIKIAIIGAGSVGVGLAEDLLNNKKAQYVARCFIDSDKGNLVICSLYSCIT